MVSNETEASEGEVTFDYDEPGKGKKLRMRPDLIFFTNKVGCLLKSVYLIVIRLFRHKRRFV